MWASVGAWYGRYYVQLRSQPDTTTNTGKRAASVSAGKYRTAVTTDRGSVFIWEAENCPPHPAAQQPLPALPWKGGSSSASLPVSPTPLGGIRRVAAVSVGEKHSLALVSLALPALPDDRGRVQLPSSPRGGSGSSADEDGFEALGGGLDEAAEGGGSPMARAALPPSGQHQPTACLGLQAAAPGQEEAGDERAVSSVPSLQTLCQRVVARHLVEPRSALQLLELADAVAAPMLRAYCLAYSLQNLDLVLLEARPAFEGLPAHLVLELEQHWKAWLSAPMQEQTTSRSSLGRAPMTGSSPVPGSSLPYGSGSLTAASSWVDRWLSDTPASASSGGALGSVTGPPVSGLRLHPKLQPGRRPTAAPAWLGGKMPHAESASLGHALQAALEAVGPSASRPAEAASAAPPDVPFTSQADVHAREREAALAKVLRNLRKKLQQAESLGVQRAAGVLLDAQQLSKLGQRECLEEAVAGLEAGVALEAVQAVLAQSQELAAKLKLAQPAVSGSSGSRRRTVSSSVPSAEASGSALEGVMELDISGGRSDSGARDEAPGPSLTLSTGAGACSAPPPFGQVFPLVGCGVPAGGLAPIAASVGGRAAGGGSGANGKERAAPRQGGLSMFLSGEAQPHGQRASTCQMAKCKCLTPLIPLLAPPRAGVLEA